MSAPIDSIPVFKQRCHDLGLGPCYAAMVSAGWDTLAKFAFSTSYTPGGAAGDDVFLKDVVRPVIGSDEGPEKPLLRRLFYEAFTLAAADLRRCAACRVHQSAC